MATLLVSYAHCVENKGEGTGEGGGVVYCTFVKGKRTFACIAWEGRRGSCGVSEVSRNVLQVGGTVALCQWLVMLQQRQVTCTRARTDKPQHCCSRRYCA